MNQPQKILDIFHDELESIAPVNSWQVTGPFGKSRKCDIYILSSSHTSEKLAAKIYRRHIVSEQTPKAQYEALTHAYKMLACPKPYGFHAETGTVLMEWIDAPRLVTALWRRTLSPKNQLQLIRQTGRWLRQLHELSDPVRETVDIQKLQTKLDTQLEKHQAAHNQLKNSSRFNAAMKTFKQMALCGEDPIPHVLLHGDFTPSNLLVKHTDVVGIDIWGARKGPIYEDIARMLTYLAIISPFALSDKPLHPDNHLIKVFQKGYGTDWFQPATQTLRAVMLYQQLRRWLVYQDRIAKGKNPFLSRWLLSRAQKTALQTHSWLEQ